MISPYKINEYLATATLGRDIIFIEKLESTNIEARNYLDKPEGTVIICEEQTAGRGRLDRKWISPRDKGIWCSVILKPNFPMQRFPMLTHLAAAAVFKGLKENGIESWIKWPNDIVIQGKKVCGILCESVSLSNSAHAVILGIGINVGQTEPDFPADIQSKATSVLLATGRSYDRNILLASIINNIEILYKQCLTKDDFHEVLNICRERSAVLGREVIVFPSSFANGETLNPPDNVQRHVKALDIDSEGCLLVRDGATGETSKLVSGEVSLRAEIAYI